MVGAQLVKRLTSEPGYGLRPVGFLDSDPHARRKRSGPAAAVPVLGGPDDLAEAVRNGPARGT